MIEVKIEQELSKATNYPKLMENKLTGSIVLSTQPNQGVLLYMANSKNHAGTFITLETDDFIDFEGSIILRNGYE